MSWQKLWARGPSWALTAALCWVVSLQARMPWRHIVSARLFDSVPAKNGTSKALATCHATALERCPHTQGADATHAHQLPSSASDLGTSGMWPSIEAKAFRHSLRTAAMGERGRQLKSQRHGRTHAQPDSIYAHPSSTHTSTQTHPNSTPACIHAHPSSTPLTPASMLTHVVLLP